MPRRLKSSRVRCQYCRKLNRTKTLEQELLCRFCNLWAKYRHQELKLTTIHDKSNHKWIKVYEPLQKTIVVDQENEIVEEITA